MMAQPDEPSTQYPVPGETACPRRAERTPPPMGDGFAPPLETVACLDDLSDGIAPAGTGNAGLAVESSAF